DAERSPPPVPVAVQLSPASEEPVRIAEPASNGPCPAEMVLAGKVCIDRYEAHLLDGSVVHPWFERPRAAHRYVAKSAPGVFPQAYISRIEAAAACDAAGKRLCSRAEWTAGCRGTRPASCNRAKTHLLPAMFPERNGLYE